MPSLSVSVIIPVYNAAEFLPNAVESALALPQVREIILVEDGSTDGSLDACREASRASSKIRLMQHPRGENKGAGASRNLGVKASRQPYIAFLDADDWYLPNRFQADEAILSADETIDGVYNALGNAYENDTLRANWLNQNRPEILTLSDRATPEQLPIVLFHAHPTISGEFSTDAITVRREFFDRIGGFHPKLRLQQDTHLWRRMSVFGRLAPGNIEEAVAIRRVHANNRMTRIEDHEQYLEIWWSELGREFRRKNAPPEVMQAYRRGYARFCATRHRRLRTLWALANWSFRDVSQIGIPYGFLDLAILETFESHEIAQRLLSLKNRVLGKLKSRKQNNEDT